MLSIDSIDAIEEALKRIRREKAREYVPVNESYITLREFSYIVNMQKKKEYKTLLKYIRFSLNGAHILIPDAIKKCFIGGNIVFDTFRGNGTVNIEYRINVESLAEEYKIKARQLIEFRKNGSNNYISRETFGMLMYLQAVRKKDITAIINELVEEAVLRTEKEKGTVTGYNGSGFRVTEEVIEKGNRVTEKVTENQKKILMEIGKNPHITALNLSLIVGISLRKIRDNISKLKRKGFIRRIGSDRKGYWDIAVTQRDSSNPLNISNI